ncbi:hypothetical protein F5B20DRAFT_541674 [Whalleya microplaca]|nr:hypothetical protein F5B20DRAFT_541674 [Whalleya microplaca]
MLERYLRLGILEILTLLEPTKAVPIYESRDMMVFSSEPPVPPIYWYLSCKFVYLEHVSQELLMRKQDIDIDSQ